MKTKIITTTIIAALLLCGNAFIAQAQTRIRSITTGQGTQVLQPGLIYTLKPNGAGKIILNEHGTQKQALAMPASVTFKSEAVNTPTSVSFANPVIYTYYGKGDLLEMTVTPAGADLSQITWTKTSSLGNISAFEYSEGIWWAGVTSGDPGQTASHGQQSVTLIATCPNGASAEVQLRTRFNMAVSTAVSPFNAGWFNIGLSYSWIHNIPKIYVRAYYGANETQWNRSNNISWEQYLTKIATSMYSITSNDPHITATPMADGVTWELTRHNFDTLKEVTLTITCGMQSYTQTLTLLKN